MPSSVADGCLPQARRALRWKAVANALRFDSHIRAKVLAEMVFSSCLNQGPHGLPGNDPGLPKNISKFFKKSLKFRKGGPFTDWTTGNPADLLLRHEYDDERSPLDV
jgi:hypothetical protein